MRLTEEANRLARERLFHLGVALMTESGGPRPVCEMIDTAIRCLRLIREIAVAPPIRHRQTQDKETS